jgi:uncharacterized protein (TIGR02996 family)
MPSLRDALEAALVENPDDLATHHAYADYLQEQGDPRGDFIQVQLALEAAGRTRAEHRRLKARERKLLSKHVRDWLGILADELQGPKEERRKGRKSPYRISFARGWLDRIIHFPGVMRFPGLDRPISVGVVRRISVEFNNVLGKRLSLAPEVRMLRELVLGYEDLAGVRAIVQSPYLHRLTHLQLRYCDLGDVGCTDIATAGILKNLKVLDLRHGEITDVGARILADCPDLKHLARLDISGNGLTQSGIDALRRVLGNALEARDQQTTEELAQRRYLFGDP